jgi:putative ABC transport system substrate-binding protein
MIARGFRLIVALAVGGFAAPLWAEAQQPKKIPRIGVLGAVSPERAPHTSALREGLRELGYVEKQNIISEWRWAEGDPRRFPGLAAELVRLNVDVIVADNNPAIAAAQKATKAIPIVMVIATDPVDLGFVASLARPGGNITGLSFLGVDLVGKRQQLLREIVPKLSKLAFLWDPSEPGRREAVREGEVVARGLGLQLQPVEVRSPDDLDNAFATMAKGGVDAVVVGGSTMTFIHRGRIAELAVRRGLPTVCAAKQFAEAGCLVSYSASFSDLFRRAAYFVDKILKGAKPGDLPIEQPTKFELVINLKTARALALTIPPSLLLRADHVIE